jgi:hypothetical protein
MQHMSDSFHFSGFKFDRGEKGPFFRRSLTFRYSFFTVVLLPYVDHGNFIPEVSETDKTTHDSR